MSKFKLGDIILATEDNSKRITNRNALLQIVDAPASKGGGTNGDFKVRVIDAKVGTVSEEWIDKVIWVYEKNYEPYRNGVLTWLHNNSK